MIKIAIVLSRHKLFRRHKQHLNFSTKWPSFSWFSTRDGQLTGCSCHSNRLVFRTLWLKIQSNQIIDHNFIWMQCFMFNVFKWFQRIRIADADWWRARYICRTQWTCCIDHCSWAGTSMVWCVMIKYKIKTMKNSSIKKKIKKQFKMELQET